jgi:hypothetical protein
LWNLFLRRHLATYFLFGVTRSTSFRTTFLRTSKRLLLLLRDLLDRPRDAQAHDDDYFGYVHLFFLDVMG